jgi:Ni,Fe-hydrogenase maturation factor
VEIDTHGMDPVRVLRLARELGGTPARTLVLACEPERIVDPETEPENVVTELSAPVRAAVVEALPAVRQLVEDLLANNEGGGRQ